jgi:hypothetical protein
MPFVQGDGELRVAWRYRVCLVATATVLELPSGRSSHASTSWLCTGRNASGQVTLPLVVPATVSGKPGNGPIDGCADSARRSRTWPRLLPTRAVRVGAPLVDSTFTLAPVSGQTVSDVSQYVMPDLGTGCGSRTPASKERLDLLAVRCAGAARVAVAAERRHRHDGHARLQPGRRGGDHVEAPRRSSTRAITRRRMAAATGQRVTRTSREARASWIIRELGPPVLAIDRRYAQTR